ncbi:MAG: choice-of-anchor I family protein, partial [Coriobacteriales bacterium]
EFLTYDLPDADKTCDWAINNKSYTIKLLNGTTEVDSVTAGGAESTKISKQKTLKRDEHADTDNNNDLKLVVWERGTANVDDAYVAANAPRNSKGEYGSVHGASSGSNEPTPPTFTPVVTSDTRVAGYNNETASLKLELAGRYNSGAMNADGGSLEIVQYNASNGYAYAVSGVKGKLIAVDLNSTMDGDKVAALTGTEYDLKAMVTAVGFTYGDMTSVAISPDGSKIAVALQDAGYDKPGRVALFSCKENGSLELLSHVAVGVQPDMVTWADKSTILTADEGEPRDGANGTDPKGSVSIVTVGEDNALTANTVTFDSFDTKRSELTAAGVLVQKNAQPSTDFEPEYIAVSGNTAYVSLQEANAIAVLDIAKGEFTGVYPLGFQDFGTTKVDLQKNDKAELGTYDNVYGIKMPDGISVATIGGKTYLLTANEGDSRSDWSGLDNEYENVTSPTGNVTLDKKVVWFNSTMWDGLDSNKAYTFGGRSFCIYEVTGGGLDLVYDSGSDFESITAEKLPTYFNCSNDKTSLDNRSGKKGPEPETVVTGTVGDRTYAFIALERIGGIMVYDITDPANAKYVNYINSREFDAAIQGDVSPEGLCFIPAEQSKTGKAMLLAACEVSGTLAAYELTPAESGSSEPVTPPS